MDNSGWNPFIPATCHKEVIPGIASGIGNVITDIYILFVPMPAVLKLQTSLKRKIKLIAIFSVGIFVCVVSVIRLVQTIVQNGDPDSTWTVGRLLVWAMLEYSIGLCCVCTLVIPAFWDRVLSGPLAKYWSRLSSSLHSKRDSSNRSKATRLNSMTSASESVVALHNQGNGQPYMHKGTVFVPHGNAYVQNGEAYVHNGNATVHNGHATVHNGNAYVKNQPQFPSYTQNRQIAGLPNHYDVAAYYGSEASSGKQEV